MQEHTTKTAQDGFAEGPVAARAERFPRRTDRPGKTAPTDGAQAVPKTLFERLSAASTEIGSVPKKPSPTGGVKYEYQQWQDVIPAVRDALHKHGLWVTVDMTGAECVQRQSRDGSPVWAWLVSLKVSVHASTPVPYGPERLDVEWRGEAADSGDKGLQKAATSGTKYCLLKLLLVPSFEPESDAEEQRLLPAQEGSDVIRRHEARRWLSGVTGDDKSANERFVTVCKTLGLDPLAAALTLKDKRPDLKNIDEAVLALHAEKAKGGAE
jgi:hypothetical protein